MAYGDPLSGKQYALMLRIYDKRNRQLERSKQVVQFDLQANTNRSHRRGADAQIETDRCRNECRLVGMQRQESSLDVRQQLADVARYTLLEIYSVLKPSWVHLGFIQLCSFVSKCHVRDALRWSSCEAAKER